MRIEAIEIGETYVGADGSKRRVDSITGFGKGAIVTYNKTETQHLHLFALWAQYEI